MHLKNRYHITYCTNVHPGIDWPTTFEAIKKHVPVIKARVAPDKPFGLGLRLSNKASEELAVGDGLDHFKSWLDQEGVYVFTMNGFPYGNFHGERVKDQVHAPDWTTLDRLRYTQRLFDQLALLLPEGQHGGISTSPVSYKHWFATPEALSAAFKKGAEYMAAVAVHLYRIESATGKYMHLDIEPEPDGLMENTEEVLLFYRNFLEPVGIPILMSELGVSRESAHELLYRYITLCYDVCHFALAYEEPEDTFLKLERAGIKVGKIQVSAALKILAQGAAESELWDTLSQFDEPIYLHQVTEKTPEGVRTHNDLPAILEARRPFTELRAHFHVPIFLERYGVLHATQDQIVKVVEYLKKKPVSEHLEIETYTWDVLPGPLKKDLSESIGREIEWLLQKLD